MNLEEEAEEIQKISSKLTFLEHSLVTAQTDLDIWKRKEEMAREAQNIIQHVAQSVQQLAHQRIAKVVSSCLSAVFDEPYTFKIDFERKRNQTEARLRFVRDGLEVDPITASGGGVIDVAAFALRIACLVLHRPRLRSVVVLDEPFKFVSAEFRSNVRTMLEGLARDMKVQIILVTHIDELETGEIIHL